MTEHHLTVPEIVKRAGGANAVSLATGAAVPTIYKWTANGIPVVHWDALVPLAGVSIEQLYAASRRANRSQETETALAVAE